MNLKLGTRSTKTLDKNDSLDGLKAKDVVSIIQACKDSNINSLEFEGLKIQFGQTVQAQSVFEPLALVEAQDQQRHAELSTSEDIVKELADHQLLITDPEAYEAKILGRNK